MKKIILFKQMELTISDVDWKFLCKNRFFTDAPLEEEIQAEFVSGTGITKNKPHLWEEAEQRFAEYVADLREIRQSDVKKLYPMGKTKAFNVTYDDGVLQDIRLVEMLNKYSLKGTFNLNFGLMENEFEWIHEKGYVIKRLSVERAHEVYAGHEIASHTLTHPYMQDKTEDEILYEMKEDKRKLETLLGSEVKGFALPFDYYSDLIEVCAKKSGFEYARISEESLSFKPQADYHRWRATVFHLNPELDNLVEKFLVTKEELGLFQIVGHSYDLDTENMWDKMENIFDKIASNEDILPMTTIEMVHYLKAMNEVEITDSEIINNSDEELWFLVEGNIVCLEPKTSFRR